MSHTVHMRGEFCFFPHGYLDGWANSLIEDAGTFLLGHELTASRLSWP